MFERQAGVIVVAAVITLVAHSASAQNVRFARGSGNGTTEHGVREIESINDRDRTDAERALYRWDANRDGSIDRDEAGRGHWSKDPFQFDADGDGRLTVSELSVRYARRRLDAQDSRSGSDSPTLPSTSWHDNNRQGDVARSTGSDSVRSDSKTNSEPNNVYAYRTRSAYERLFGGLPTWFKEKDTDLDGQLMMSEFASDWTDALAREFSQLDPNGDGVITSKECLGAEGGESVASREPVQEAPPESPSKASDTADQLAENGTLSPAEAKAAARESRRQLWGKLYSSQRPASPPADPAQP